MNILGLNAYHGDVSAVLVRDGQLVAAIEEERFRRIKHCAGFPDRAIAECLRMAGSKAATSTSSPCREIRARICGARRCSCSSIARSGRSATACETSPASGSCPARLPRRSASTSTDVRPRMRYVEHHPRTSPARRSSARSTTPRCARSTGSAISSARRGDGWRIRRSRRPARLLPALARPAVSRGHAVSRISQLRRRVQGDGPRAVRRAALRPGDRIARQPSRRRHVRARPVVLQPLVGRRSDDLGRRRTRPSAASSRRSSSSCSGRRAAGTSRSQPKHEAIAASLQVAFERAQVHVLRHVYEATKNPRLCLAGGCAMNSVANGKIRENTPFRDVYIQPAAGDNGTALGAAFDAWHASSSRSAHVRHGARLLGPRVRRLPRLRRRCRSRPARFAPPAARERRWDDEDALDAWTASQIAAGRVVGWFQGRMEWGARALGNRSILADPAASRHARHHQHAHQVPRAVPAVRAVGGRRSDRRLLRRRRARPVHAAGVSDPARQTRGRAGRDARGRLGPAADRQPPSRTPATGI